MKQPTRSSSEVQQLRATVTQLQELLRRMQYEREVAARNRRKRMLMIAIPISLALHVMLMIYLAMMYRGGDGGEAVTPMYIEFAMVQDEELTVLEDSDLSGLIESEAIDLSVETVDPTEVSLDLSSPTVELIPADIARMESLLGSGDGLGGDGGLGAGGGGTSFFGISARGTRFAFVVDRSGSMSYRERMGIAISELTKSIRALPDYAYFTVVFFSSDLMLPPMQRGWIPARGQNVSAMVRWLSSVDPGGGTLPRSAFQHVFNMDVLPDVIFFMTDGIIAVSALTPEEVAAMNSRSKKVVIHTIAFGDEGSEQMLRRIARESGGTYRYVPDGGPRP